MGKRRAASKRVAKATKTKHAKPKKQAIKRKQKTNAKPVAANPEWIEDEFKNPYNY